MSFSARIARLPRPFDATLAADAHIGDLTGDLAALARAAAGCSPYLAGLLTREADWVADAAAAPETAVRAAWAIDPASPTLETDLRQAKRRVALLTALADLGGVWPLETVTEVLTEFADAACDLALKAALRPLAERGKLPGVTAGDLADAAGLAVFAMGKMGAHELNYSSDIDLICLFDETRHDPAHYPELRAGFVRAVRKMCSVLSDIGPEGYVFRTDLRLRPDAGVTPVVLSMGAAERYYESMGRTWERGAWIKARPAAGDLDAGARFQKSLRPFVWRKHLDFAAIQDAHDMRLAIRDAKGLSGPITLAGHNMKLGRGGIREIEFFTQTRQLISGGRDPSLRARATVPALARLAAADWITEGRAEELTEHYRFYRVVEHRLQMVRDAQTHALPRDVEGFQRLAAMLDMDPDALQARLHARLTAVHQLTEGFFAPQTPQPAAAHGAAAALPDRWRGYPAFRSPRAQESFERILPALAEGLSAAARPDEATAAFDGFLAGLPAGVQLFALFEANPQLLELLLDILTVAPPLAEYLSRNAQVLDAVIGGAFFAPWPGADALRAQLEAALEPGADYESKLDATRRWRKEWHFRVGVHHLRGLTDAAEAARQYADLAQAVVQGLWPHVVAQFAERHGPPPGRGACLIGMGSLGAGRLTPTSDLDLIVVYDPEGVEESSGRKPLLTRTYFARLTQAMVTALAAQTAEGRLYEVDMRLRPSGNQGPVATSWRAFQDYQQNEAWLWEHLALTRARVIAGPAGMAEEVAGFLRGILARPRTRADVLREIRQMRARIADSKPDTGPWALKTGPGRLQDIELFVQAGALLVGAPAHDIARAMGALPASGLLTDAAAERLRATYQMASRVQLAQRLVQRLVGGRATQMEALGDSATGVMLRAVGAPDIESAEAQLRAAFSDAEAIIEAGLQDE